MEVDEGYLGNFYKFRFTLPDRELFPRFEECLIELMKTLDIREGGKTQWWSIGYEELNGYGEESKPHFHIHFATTLQESALRKRLTCPRNGLFRREDFQVWTAGLTGNRLYSLKNVDVDEGGVRDYNRFFRYPFKQVLEQHRAFEVPPWHRLPSGFDIRTQTLIAHDEWIRDVEFKKNARQRAEAPTTKDKLFEWLDGRVGDAPTSKRGLLLLIIEFYAQEEKSANKQTMLGYLQTALWRYKVETFEETADKWLKEI